MATRPGRVGAVGATIAVLSQKGGTGKTTTVRTLADVLRRRGMRVLAVDLDPQGNLSDYFDVDPAASPTVGDVLSGNAKARDAIRFVPPHQRCDTRTRQETD